METNYTTKPPTSGHGPPPKARGPRGSTDRIEQFRSDISDLDVKTPADSNERWFLLGGIVLEVLGVLFILGGYVGASGTAILAEQMPYLLSGGMLGLAFIIIGVGLFVRYSMTRYLRFWLVREIYEQRAQADRLTESITGVEKVLRAATRPRSSPD